MYFFLTIFFSHTVSARPRLYLAKLNFVLFKGDLLEGLNFYFFIYSGIIGIWVLWPTMNYADFLKSALPRKIIYLLLYLNDKQNTYGTQYNLALENNRTLYIKHLFTCSLLKMSVLRTTKRIAGTTVITMNVPTLEKYIWCLKRN